MSRGTFVPAFRRAAACWPEAPAILFEGRTVFTYAELVRRAERISAKLGDVKGELLELRIPKSPEYIANMLGIWFAGAAFVPLDPALPGRRLALMSREARLAPRGLAYVIYTSGSTGTPKGVMVGHDGIIGLLRAQIEAFKLRPGCRSLFYLPISFDASLSDIGTALLSGAALCLEAPGADLPALLAARGITHMDVPPSLLARLDPAAMPASLETVVIGGEVCPPAIVRRWARRFRVVNVYGPTEATVCTSLSVCDPKRWRRPSIGRPLPGVVYRVLDEDLRPVPSGAAGELYIGGDCLARGYLNRPDLTAERFVVREGERLYRTGDRVAARGKDFDFLGRFDRQIKLRGLRIEPGEIEAALLEHPGVRAAAVVKRRGELTAFVIVDGRARALRSHLSRRLPRWMLPQRIEILKSLPLTAGGKTDVAALARSPRSRPKGSARGSITRLLSEAWKTALCVKTVGLRDGFYASGGDSLAALAAVAAAEERGLRVAPSWMSEGVTIESLARRLEAQRPVEAKSASDLRKDAIVEPMERGAAPKDPPARILLTGATGFLGSRLLFELLRQSRAEATCLVRVRDRAEGIRRIEAALARHGLSLTPALQKRVVPLCGDLDEPRFGLTRGEWDRLAGRLDSVYHCGANVNLTLSYEALRRTNVEGAREALRLVREGRPKSFHYASTLSVFVATDRNKGAMREDDVLDKTSRVYGGYAQSKWAAEVMLRASGVPFSCYRFGLITGGYCPPHDLLSLFIKGAAATRRVPRLPAERLKVDITPVEYAAAAMARISLNAPPGTFHIANPRGLTLRGLIAALRAHGVPLKEVRARDWRGSKEAAAYLALKSRLPGAFERLRALDLFQATGARFMMDRTRRALSGSGLSCPPPDARLLQPYLRRILGEPA